MRKFLILPLVMFPLAVLAQVDIEADPGGFFAMAFDAIRSGNWQVVAALAVIALVWAARKWGGELVPWLKSKRGGATLALAAGVLGALAHAAVAGGEINTSLVVDGLKTGFLAAGGWTTIRILAGVSEGVRSEKAKKEPAG